MKTQVSRYSQSELEEFRLLIEGKKVITQTQIDRLQAQIDDVNDDEDDHGKDLIEDGNNSSQLEMLSGLLAHQMKHIRDLDNALIRIKNKSYGICIVTGELIDKRRLFAVLTTTKSLVGKNMPLEKIEKPIVKMSSAPKSFSKVIKKTPLVSTVEKPKYSLDDDYEEDDYEEDDEDFSDDNFIDLDSISEEDLD